MTIASQRFSPGFHPFWFWNGNLETDEIKRQIRLMAEQGVRGFFIHSRQGLTTAYLSDSFMNHVRTAVETANELGLAVHIYDEFPYPSGSAGGRVTLGSPDMVATQLVQGSVTVSGGDINVSLPAGKVLNCTAFPVNGETIDWNRGIEMLNAVGICYSENTYHDVGLTEYNRKRFLACQPVPTLQTVLPDGQWLVSYSVQTAHDRFKYFGHNPDMMNPSVIQRFITETHERYRSFFGDDFSKAFVSVFTDEVCAGWTDKLPDAYEKKYGESLLAALPAIQNPSHPSHIDAQYKLRQLQNELFIGSFEIPVRDWCKTNGILYGGEKPSMRLSQLKYMDVPGCEPGHTKAGSSGYDLLKPMVRGNARETACAAYLYDKIGAQCECYHSMGWGATLQDAKLIADGLLLHGIRFLVPHGFFYTTHSLAKHDAPPSFFFQMPYWPHFNQLASHVERILAAFEGTHIHAHTLVVSPHGGLPDQTMLEKYQQLLHGLMAEHIDFIIADTDALVDAEPANGCFRIKDLDISVIVLPPMRIVEPSLEAALRRFETSGGSVFRLDSQTDMPAFLKTVRSAAPDELGIKPVSGRADAVHVIVRKSGERALAFLINTASTPVEIELTGKRPFIVKDTVEHAASTRRLAGQRLKLQPYESILLEAGSEPNAREMIEQPIAVGGPAVVVPLAKNLLRMADWRLSLDDQPVNAEMPAMSVKPIINLLQETRLPFSPEIQLSFGASPLMKLPMLTARYEYAFTSCYSGAVELVMEPGSIVGDASIEINQRRIAVSEFKPTCTFINGCLGLDISDCIQEGINKIVVSVRMNRSDGGLVNPLYLAGGFAVKLSDGAAPELAPFNLNGQFESYRQNGLPYFSGIVEYRMPINLPSAPAGADACVSFEFAEPFEDCFEASFNDCDWIAIPFTPHRAIIPAGVLKSGSNDLRLRVLTTLIRSFEGLTFDTASHAYREA